MLPSSMMLTVSNRVILLLHTCSLLSLKYAESHPRRSNVLLVYPLQILFQIELKLIFQVLRKRMMVSVSYENHSGTMDQ